MHQELQAITAYDNL